MALLVDGSYPTVEELQRYEGAIADVANTERIDIGDKMSLARAEIGTELSRFLKEQRSFSSTGGAESQVVLTEPLRRWLVLHSIAGVYREARFGQVSDRYGAKWKEYSQLAYQARHDLMSNGIGVVWTPIHRPGRPVTATIAGNLAAGTYFMRISWTGPDGVESEASEPVAHTLASTGGIRVMAAAAPTPAVGWRLYAGQLEAELTVQGDQSQLVDEPLDLTGELSTAGHAPSAGQLPDVLVRVFNSLLRG